MRVLCLTDKTTFPHGEATGFRIMMIAKALISKGTEFMALSIMANKNPLNKEVSGISEEVFYKNLCGSTKIVDYKIFRKLLYLRGLVNLTFFMWFKTSRSDVVYICSHGTLFNLFCIILSQLKRLRIVQEINEWEDWIDKKWFTRIMYRRIMLRYSQGVIAISENIENLIFQNKHTRKNLKILRVPIITDIRAIAVTESKNQPKYGLWMGIIDAYLKDILLILESLSYMITRDKNVVFYVIGRYSENSMNTIKNRCKALKIPEENFRLTGYLDDQELLRFCSLATYFIVPLWNDYKSENRFPTKISQFLACGKPIITCNIGETGKYLSDNETALFFEPGNSGDLYKKIEWIYSNTEAAQVIGRKGYQLALNNFHYENYSQKLNRFFTVEIV